MVVFGFIPRFSFLGKPANYPRFPRSTYRYPNIIRERSAIPSKPNIFDSLESPTINARHHIHGSTVGNMPHGGTIFRHRRTSGSNPITSQCRSPENTSCRQRFQLRIHGIIPLHRAKKRLRCRSPRWTRRPGKPLCESAYKYASYWYPAQDRPLPNTIRNAGYDADWVDSATDGTVYLAKVA